MITITLSLVSCAVFESKTLFNKRDVANLEVQNEVQNEEISLRELMRIKSTPVYEIGNNFTSHMNSPLYRPKNVLFELVLDEKLESDTAFVIVPEIVDRHFKIKIIHSKSALADRAAAAEVDRMIKKMFISEFVSQFSFFELYFNALSNDLESKLLIANLRSESLRSINESKVTNLDVYKYALEQLSTWDSSIKLLQQKIKEKNKQNKELTDIRKEIMNALDKASEDQQFRNLVARNNRKEAAKLLRYYLPFELMPPFEKAFWENHLDVMENPLPLNKRVIVYRGISDDIVQAGYKMTEKQTLNEAIKDQNIFLMSTIMTKNQGTWNRRLRSLTAMYDKYIATDFSNSSSVTKTSRMTVMFFKHSKTPQGSPFLSYTPNFKVSEIFGKDRNTLFLADPRTLYYNFSSHYATEVEYLLPLVTFPEDLGAVYDLKVHHHIEPLQVETFLKETSLEKLKVIYGEKEATIVWNQIQKNTLEFFDDTKKSTANGSFIIDSKFLTLFKQMVLKSDLGNIANINESGLSCFELIEGFWK